MTAYKALRINLSGNIIPAIESMRLNELASGEVVIDVHYSSINYKDALAITGKSRIMRTYPTTAGIDVAGVVEQSTDDRYQVGDKVLVTGYGIGEASNGGLAEKLQTNADKLVKLTENFDLKDVMALGTAGFTAGISVMRMLDNGQTPEQGPILVTGATGGVGSVAIHYLHKLGFEVHALTRKVEQSGEYLKSLGADQVIDYNTLEMGDKPLERAIYAGAIDSVGGKTLGWITKIIKPEGNIASCGLAGGIDLNTTVMPFILRGINLLGIDSVNLNMQARLRVWQQLAETLDKSDLDLIINSVIALDDVIGKVNDFMDGKVVGRYVVDLKA
jgi:NADPH2:quinone reductase